jgi:hypothetical protein
MLIDVQLLAATHVILPPAPSVFQESSDAGVYTRGSVRRASGFVLTGNPEVSAWTKTGLISPTGMG